MVSSLLNLTAEAHGHIEYSGGSLPARTPADVFITCDQMQRRESSGIATRTKYSFGCHVYFSLTQIFT
jgi:hypothetical protein